MDAKLPTGAWEMSIDLDVPYVLADVSFEDLYRIEYPRLIAVAAAMTGDFGTSEDLVQDTMVKAFVRWSWLRSMGRPGAWCHRVLSNACRDWGRRRRREQHFVDRHRHSGVYAAEPSPDAVAFWAAVRRLPTRPRLVTALFYAADHTTAEVAAILGVPEGTVRSDLSRARVALARELGVLP